MFRVSRARFAATWMAGTASVSAVGVVTRLSSREGDGTAKSRTRPNCTTNSAMTLLSSRTSQVFSQRGGIVGFIQRDGFSASTARAVLLAMSAAMAHRGPDDDGVWIDIGSGVAMAHRRLAVIDLSSAGHQPMCSATGLMFQASLEGNRRSGSVL